MIVFAVMKASNYGGSVVQYVFSSDEAGLGNNGVLRNAYIVHIAYMSQTG